MKKNVLSFSFALALVFSLTSCHQDSFREGVIVAGGTFVPHYKLNKGKQIYAEYCMACHGEKGDGKGVASKGMTVPPRNFTLGLIKFGDVLAGELPHDEAIYKTLKHGLSGTAMLPWDLQPGQMDAVWQYIKTFAPETWVGKDKELGKRVTLAADPYGLAHKSSAIKKGAEVYHVTANCQSCHRAYVSHSDFAEMSKRLTGEVVSNFDEEMYKVKPQDSEHGGPTIPPEFTWDHIRSAKTVEELAYRIATGVGGTAMPAWKETITDDEIWAVAYYVKSLTELKDSAERKSFMTRISN